MYVILSSKPGQFTTELGEGLEQVEAYDYVFYGKTKARYVIARLTRDVKVRIVDASSAVNQIPSKMLPKFDTLEKARAELDQLAGNASLDVRLVKQ